MSGRPALKRKFVISFFQVASPLVSALLWSLPGRRGEGDSEMVLVRGHVNSSTSGCPFHTGSDSSQRMGPYSHSAPYKPGCGNLDAPDNGRTQVGLL